MPLSRPLWWLCALTCFWSCREQPGEIVYNTADFERPNPFAVESLPGPDPFTGEADRLAFGLFYEGGASDVWAIDDANVFFYIYLLEATGEPTFGQSIDIERIEGTQSHRWTHRGLGWWGGGIHFAAPRDMSRFTTLHVSFQSSSDGFSDVDITIESNATSVGVNITDYGYTNDGGWYSIAIPLSDFIDRGLDISQVTIPFMFGGANAQAGESIRIDNLYFE